MTLHDDVSSWQDGWATAPIYRAGHEWVDGNGKTHVSDGKQPFPRSRYVKYSAQRSLQLLDEKFSAIGIWFGQRSNGLVCLDIDGNLDKFLKRHPSILDGAHIKSPKTDRAKVLFQVPEELWPDVKGYDNSTHTYQVLWEGKMGVCAGEYGAGGHYNFVPGDVPQAPDWMLEEMLATKQRRDKVQLNTADMRCDTVEEAEGKLRDWLSVIPFEGDWLGEDLDTESWWFRVGACIAGAGIGEKGLEVWQWYSQLDERYKDDWQYSDPCDERWWSLTVDGGLGPGTLCKLADQYDPERKRLPEAQRSQLKLQEELKEHKVDGYEELIKAAQKAMEEDDPGLVQHKLHQLAIANGYRDSSAVSKLLLAHEEYEAGHHVMTVAQLYDMQEEVEPDYLIPDLIPMPSTTLLHGRGGTGKTLTAMHLAKHVARGIPYKVRGADMPIKQGRVLWLNGDQNPSRLFRQLTEAGIERDDDIVILTGVSMLWQSWFIRQIDKYEPRLVVWDSVTSCMRGSHVNQNQAEYADPLYFLSMRNGSAFKPVANFVLHHQNMEGGARGTTALEDAVDEVWGLRKPNDKEKERLGNKRVLDIGKSREDNEGRQFYISRNSDYTLSIEDTKEVASAGVVSSIEQMLGAMRNRYEWMASAQVMALPVSGTPNTKKANLTRLVSKGLVERRGSRRNYEYRAVLSRVGSQDACNLGGETHVPDEEVSLVAPLVARIESRTDKVETQETLNKDAKGDATIDATNETPSPGMDLERKDAKGTAPRARDPFDSTGLTD